MMLSDCVHFDDIISFVDSVFDELDDVHYEETITIFAKYEQAKEIIKEMLFYENVLPNVIHIENPNIDNYTDEYIIDIVKCDNEISLYCESAKRDNRYFNYIGKIGYILDNCNSRILNTCQFDTIHAVSINDSEESDCDEYEINACETKDTKNSGLCAEYFTNENGELNGFTVTKQDNDGYCSYSLYTDKSLSKLDIDDFLKIMKF